MEVDVVDVVNMMPCLSPQPDASSGPAAACEQAARSPGGPLVSSQGVRFLVRIPRTSRNFPQPEDAVTAPERPVGRPLQGMWVALEIARRLASS